MKIFNASLLNWGIAALALAATGCMPLRRGTGDSQSGGASSLKVIGGQEVRDDQYPAVRRLDTFKRESWGGFSLHSLCTMTFVRPAVALTAAHCVCRGERHIYKDREQMQDFVARRIERHPAYRCGDQTTAANDIALVWFDEKLLNMRHASIAEPEQLASSGQLLIVGYGDNMLKITGSFWLGTRRAESFRSKPAGGLVHGELNGKRAALIPWDNAAPAADGFIKVAAEFDVEETGDITAVSEFGAAGEGDSGGPALLPESGRIIAVAALGAYQAQGIRSNRVKVSTHLVDLRHDGIRRFLRNFEIIPVNAYDSQ